MVYKMRSCIPEVIRFRRGLLRALSLCLFCLALSSFIVRVLTTLSCWLLSGSQMAAAASGIKSVDHVVQDKREVLFDLSHRTEIWHIHWWDLSLWPGGPDYPCVTLYPSQLGESKSMGRSSRLQGSWQLQSLKKRNSYSASIYFDSACRFELV